MRDIKQYLTLFLIIAVTAIGVSIALYSTAGLEWYLSVIVSASAAMAILSAIVAFRQDRFLRNAGTLLDGIREFEADVDRRLSRMSDTGADVPSATSVEMRLSALEDRINAASFSKAGTLSQNAEETDELDTAKVIPLAEFKEARDRGVEDKATSAPVERAEVIDKLKAEPLTMVMQPVFALPNKDIRHYEAFACLDEEGETIKAGQFMSACRESGMTFDVDRQMLSHVLELAERLSESDIDAGIFWNVSSETLLSDTGFAETTRMLKAARPHLSRIYPEISAKAYSKDRSGLNSRLSEWQSIGIASSVDGIDDQSLVEKAVSSGLFAHIKSPAKVLLGYPGRSAEPFGSLISPLVLDEKVKLVATEVETEEEVMGLIDCDISLVQGNFLSPPRPMKKTFSRRATEETGT